MYKGNEIAPISSIANRSSKSNSTFIFECKYLSRDCMNANAGEDGEKRRCHKYGREKLKQEKTKSKHCISIFTY